MLTTLDQEKDVRTSILNSLLGDDWPPELIVISVPSINKHYCYAYGGVHGLAVFSNEAFATRFMEFVTGISPVQYDIVSFDEARDIAKSKGGVIVALHLLDNIDDPKTHYVA